MSTSATQFREPTSDYTYDSESDTPSYPPSRPNSPISLLSAPSSSELLTISPLAPPLIILPDPIAAITNMNNPTTHQASPLLKLPYRKNKQAPRTFTGKYNEVVRFLRHYNRLCNQHEVVSGSDRCEGILEYCSSKVRDFIESSQYFMNNDWSGLEDEMLKYYDADREKSKYNLADLISYLKKTNSRPLRTLSEWKKYYREYTTRAGFLQAKHHLSAEDTAGYLWYGLPYNIRTIFEGKLSAQYPEHDTSLAWPIEAVSSVAEAYFKRDKFSQKLLHLPALGIDIEDEQAEDDDYELDDSDSDSDSDDETDYRARYKERQRRRTKHAKSKSQSTAKPPPTRQLDEERTRKIVAPQEEVEGIIQQLNSMSLDDTNYGQLYYKAVNADSTGYAVKCIRRPPPQESAAALPPTSRQTFAVSTQAPTSSAPYSSPATYPNSIPVPIQQQAYPPRSFPPLAPGTRPTCYGCGDESHMLGNCPRMAELTQQGIIHYDAVERKHIMRDGRRLRRLPEESLVQAVERMTASLPPPPNNSTISNPRVNFVALSTTRIVRHEAPDDVEWPSTDDHDDGPYWREGQEPALNGSYPTFAMIEPYDHYSSDSDEDSEDEGPEPEAFIAERSSKKSTQARKEHMKVPAKPAIRKRPPTPPLLTRSKGPINERPILDQVPTNIRADRPARPRNIPAIMSEPIPVDVRQPIIIKDVTMEDQNVISLPSGEPITTKQPSKKPSATTSSSRPSPSNRDRPPHEAESEAQPAEKNRNGPRQSDISAQVDTKDVVKQILDVPVAISLRDLIGSSKEIATTIQDMIKLRNTASPKAGSNMVTHAAKTPTVYKAMRPRNDELLIKLQMKYDDQDIVAIIDTGSQLNVVSEDFAIKTIRQRINLSQSLYMHDANGGEGYLKGMLENVLLTCGGVATHSNLYVGENVPFDLLLGRPWQRGNFVTIDERPSGTFLIFKDPATAKPQYEIFVEPEALTPRTFKPIHQVHQITASAASDMQPTELSDCSLEDLLEFERFLQEQGDDTALSDSSSYFDVQDVQWIQDVLVPLLEPDAHGDGKTLFSRILEHMNDEEDDDLNNATTSNNLQVNGSNTLIKHEPGCKDEGQKSFHTKRKQNTSSQEALDLLFTMQELIMQAIIATEANSNMCIDTGRDLRSDEPREQPQPSLLSTQPEIQDFSDNFAEIPLSMRSAFTTQYKGTPEPAYDDINSINNINIYLSALQTMAQTAPEHFNGLTEREIRYARAAVATCHSLSLLQHTTPDNCELQNFHLRADAGSLAGIGCYPNGTRYAEFVIPTAEVCATTFGLETVISGGATVIFQLPDGNDDIFRICNWHSAHPPSPILEPPTLIEDPSTATDGSDIDQEATSPVSASDNPASLPSVPSVFVGFTATAPSLQPDHVERVEQAQLDPLSPPGLTHPSSCANTTHYQARSCVSTDPDCHNISNAGLNQELQTRSRTQELVKEGEADLQGKHEQGNCEYMIDFDYEDTLVDDFVLLNLKAINIAKPPRATTPTFLPVPATPAHLRGTIALPNAGDDDDFFYRNVLAYGAFEPISAPSSPEAPTLHTYLTPTAFHHVFRSFGHGNAVNSKLSRYFEALPTLDDCSFGDVLTECQLGFVEDLLTLLVHRRTDTVIIPSRLLAYKEPVGMNQDGLPLIRYPWVEQLFTIALFWYANMNSELRHEYQRQYDARSRAYSSSSESNMDSDSSGYYLESSNNSDGSYPLLKPATNSAPTAVEHWRATTLPQSASESNLGPTAPISPLSPLPPPGLRYAPPPKFDFAPPAPLQVYSVFGTQTHDNRRETSPIATRPNTPDTLAEKEASTLPPLNHTGPEDEAQNPGNSATDLSSTPGLNTVRTMISAEAVNSDLASEVSPETPSSPATSPISSGSEAYACIPEFSFGVTTEPAPNSRIKHPLQVPSRLRLSNVPPLSTRPSTPFPADVPFSVAATSSSPIELDEVEELPELELDGELDVIPSKDVPDHINPNDPKRGFGIFAFGPTLKPNLQHDFPYPTKMFPEFPHTYRITFVPTREYDTHRHFVYRTDPHSANFSPHQVYPIYALPPSTSRPSQTPKFAIELGWKLRQHVWGVAHPDGVEIPEEFLQKDVGKWPAGEDENGRVFYRLPAVDVLLAYMLDGWHNERFNHIPVTPPPFTEYDDLVSPTYAFSLRDPMADLVDMEPPVFPQRPRVVFQDDEPRDENDTRLSFPYFGYLRRREAFRYLQFDQDSHEYLHHLSSSLIELLFLQCSEPHHRSGRQYLPDEPRPLWDDILRPQSFLDIFDKRCRRFRS